MPGAFPCFLNCGDRLYSRSVLSETAEFIENGERKPVPHEAVYFYGDQYIMNCRTVRCIPRRG